MKDEAFVLSQTYMMGPNCMLLLEEMIDGHRDAFNDARALDLGCGQGLTTLRLAHRTGARQIFATDLWVSATELLRNFCEWEIDDRTVPIHADGKFLPYADEYFDAIVSVDAYHYFGRERGFFAEKIWPLVRPGGRVFICVPGTKREYHGAYPELICEWLGEETASFHSADWWADNIRCNAEKIAGLTVFESSISEQAWADWFASGHEFAVRDQHFFDRGLGGLVTFISMVVEKAE